jgi:hypothetical protein
MDQSMLLIALLFLALFVPLVRSDVAIQRKVPVKSNAYADLALVDKRSHLIRQAKA